MMTGMNQNKINGWLTLVANIGVLVGLGILIFEINQSNSLALAQIEQIRSESLLQWRREWVTDDYIAPLLTKVDTILPDDELNQMSAFDQQKATAEMLDELDPVERTRMSIFIQTSYWDYENLYFQYKRGLVSDGYWRERIVPAILYSAPQWKAVTGGDLLYGRQEFNDEVERILNARE
jgi:hypothetical protein